MKYLVISSRGEIEIAGLSLMGASVKKENESLGFGSGLKYSVASLLRAGTKFKVFSGVNEVSIDTVAKDFRGSEFNIIRVNGEPTSLTTQLGVGISNDWDTAFPVFREIYRNALEEGEDSLLVQDGNSIIPEEGTTKICIEYTKEYMEFFVSFDQYFSTKIKELGIGNRYSKITRVLPKGKDSNVRIFRQGILSYWVKPNTNDKPSLYNYDFDDIEINEARVLSNIHATHSTIGSLWIEIDNLNLFKNYVNGLKNSNTGFFEHECMPMDWVTYNVHDDIKEWIVNQKWVAVEHLSLFGDSLNIDDFIAMPFTWLKAYRHSIPEMYVHGISEEGDVVSITATPEEHLFDKVQEALDTIDSTLYKGKIKGKFKVTYKAFDDKNIQGRALNGEIQLSVTLSNKTSQEIAKVIIHEYWHLVSGKSDSTREFESFMLDEFFNVLIRTTAKEPLKQEIDVTE